MKKITLSLLIIFSLVFNTKAQDGFEQALLGSVEDSENLIQAYFNPGIEGFINSMNSGWYHTAKVHKKFGFDITIGLNGSFIPSDKKTFNIEQILDNGSSISSNSTTASTFAGADSPTTFTVTTTEMINGTEEEITASFDLPGGINSSIVPAPAVQVGLGLPYKFEVMARFFPETKIGDDEGKMRMFGIGLKKEITSWFGPLDKLPLHVSLLATYTNLDLNYGFGDQSGAIDIQDGSGEFGLSAFSFQAIASLNFPIINIYGGLGYNSGNANLTMNGEYTGNYTYSGGSEDVALTPPSLDFKSNSFNTTLGARLSLGFFKIFGSYSIQEYNTANLGIAFSLR